MRQKAFTISEEIIALQFVDDEGATRYLGVPYGAVYVRSFHDWERRLFTVVFEHESFPIVRPGEILECVPIECERVDLGEAIELGEMVGMADD